LGRKEKEKRKHPASEKEKKEVRRWCQLARAHNNSWISKGLASKKKTANIAKTAGKTRGPKAFRRG